MAKSRRLSPWIRRQIWQRWLNGETLKTIGRALEVSTPGVWQQIARAGGIAPRPRSRRVGALSEREREEISRLLARRKSLRFIAGKLSRSPSTISREVRRNGGARCYRAVSAEQRASKLACRPQRCKLARLARLRRCVARKLKQYWSPQQIAVWLRETFANDPTMQVSHETIYRTLYIQARGALRKELQQYLRTHRVLRRPRTDGTNSSASIVDGISISERPAAVEDRAVPGHWEGDLLFGTPTSCIATLVERATRYVMLVRTPSKDTKTVTAALRRTIRRLPSQLRQSLTWDRGSELSAHKELSISADIDIYFCDPHSPWQRGTNENTNGLLRQYFPNGTDLSHYDQRHLDRVARQLNGRPRQTLGWKTPAQVLNQVLR
jgi:transposase, IS30 family